MKFDIDTFVADIKAANADSSPRHAVCEVMKRAVADPQAVGRAFGPHKAGGSTALYRSPGLSIFHIVWPPEIHVEPHEHNMWAVMGVYEGVEDNTFFRRTELSIERHGAVRLERGDTRIMGPDGIHAVDVPTLSPTGALHVYGGDLVTVERSEFDDDTYEERAYDWRKSERRFQEMNARWHAREGHPSSA